MSNMDIMESLLEANISDLAELGMISSLLSGVGNLFSLAIYILTAYSLYAIAKRRGLTNPFLAWIPVAQLWTLGAISDDYHLKKDGVKKSKRKILIVLEIVNVVLCIVMMVLLAIFVVSAMDAGLSSDLEEFSGVIGSMLGMMLALLAVSGVSIAVAVVRYMALYDIYCSCDPGNAVLFLLLNIFIGITQPILLLVSHKKDDGMPRTANPTEPWENV